MLWDPVVQAANAAGYGGESHEAMLEAAKVPAGRYSHFVELHIEQVCEYVWISPAEH